MEYLAFALLFFLFLFILAFACVSVSFCWSLVATRAPFIPIPKEVLPDIIEALDLKEGSVVYDLGCGDGRAVESFYHSQPKSICIGVEKDLIPFCLAWYRARKYKKGEIKIVRKNFFKQDVSDASHVFLYLFPKITNDLLPKLSRELKPGSRVVSCSFDFENRQPSVHIHLNRPKGELVQDIYVYDF